MSDIEYHADVIASVDDLILLSNVESAHKIEQTNWFDALLSMVGKTKANKTDEFFSDYEKLYKEKAQVTRMPTTYRTAKTVIKQGLKYGINMWAEGDDGTRMGKSAIEKEVRKERKALLSETSPDDLVGTIIKSVDSINQSLKQLDVNSKAYKRAVEILNSELEFPYDEPPF